MTLHVSPPVVALTSGDVTGPPQILSIGQSASISLNIGGADTGFPFPGCTLNPGSDPLRFTVLTTNSTVARTSRGSIALDPGDMQAGFYVTAQDTGTAVVSVQPPDGIGLAANLAALTVVVTSGP